MHFGLKTTVKSQTDGGKSLAIYVQPFDIIQHIWLGRQYADTRLKDNKLMLLGKVK